MKKVSVQYGEIETGPEYYVYSAVFSKVPPSEEDVMEIVMEVADDYPELKVYTHKVRVEQVPRPDLPSIIEKHPYMGTRFDIPQCDRITWIDVYLQ